MSTKLILSLSLLFFLSQYQLQANDSLDDDLSAFGMDEADEENEFSDDLDGFESDTINSEVQAPVTKAEPKRYSISGDLAFKSSAGFHKHEVDGVEYSGINQAQLSLFLQLDYKISDTWKFRISGDALYDSIYDLYSNNDYNQDVLDTYKTDFMMQDAYIQGRITNNLDVKIGHQIVVWGKSDSIRITDVINPLDNRLPGITDIKDLRVSVGMIKTDYYLGAWNLSAMIIASNKIMLEPTPRGEFFPIDSIFSSAQNPFIPLVKPEYSTKNLQYAFAANGIFSGWDLSFYGANVFDSKWYINQISHKREVAKIQMLGSALNIATGSWLLKSEIALIDKIKYNATQDEKTRFDSLIGFDYMGIKESVISLEIASRHIFDYEKQMGESVSIPDYVDKNEIQTALRVTRSFANDTINTNALLSMFGASWENGGFARVWLEYDVMDGVVSNIGVVDYIGGEKILMQANKDNDRIFADISYSF